jgi:type VI protein secretion system component VasK
MNANVKNTDVGRAETPDTREIVKARFHDLQNHLHLATMEVELAQLDVTQRVDCLKLLQILNAFKQSLQELRDQLLPSNESEGQPR